MEIRTSEDGRPFSCDYKQCISNKNKRKGYVKKYETLDENSSCRRFGVAYGAVLCSLRAK